MESIITKYTHNCIFCGRPTNVTHHLVFGTADRKKSDDFGLTIPICDLHHSEIHLGKRGSNLCADMSKIIGQLAYEKSLVAKGDSEEVARQKFRQEFGQSFL